MGGEHHRRSLVGEALHVAPEVAAQLDVHAGGGLVEEEHRRPVHERLGDEQAPLHSPRERARVGVALLPEAQVAQELLDARLVEPHAEVAGLELERLLDGEEGIEVDLLRHQPHRSAREAVVAHHVVAEHFHRALAGERRAGHQADERGLACAVRAQEREDLAAVDVEVEVIEGGESAVALGRAAQANRFHHLNKMPQRASRCARLLA